MSQMTVHRGAAANRWKRLKKDLYRYRYMYLLLLPGIFFLLIFRYVPIYGIQLAFKKYSIRGGIMGSRWIGWSNFQYLFMEPEFWNAFNNTLIISLMKTFIGFPIPVILAILLNEMRSKKYQRVVQTVLTFPHFLSWVVLSGIMFTLLSSTGAINNLIALMGGGRINFLTNKHGFRWLLVWSQIWKESGWSAIIYLATITGIDQSLYEAATIDGANRWDRMVHVTWPGLRPVVITMLILNVGSIMEAGYMQVLNLYNPAVYSTADILDTYVYRISFQKATDFGVSTAVSLFKGVTNCVLLFVANFIAKRFGEQGIS